jgi:hypothetical protein
MAMGRADSWVVILAPPASPAQPSLLGNGRRIV